MPHNYVHDGVSRTYEVCFPGIDDHVSLSLVIDLAIIMDLSIFFTFKPTQGIFYSLLDRKSGGRLDQTCCKIYLKHA